MLKQKIQEDLKSAMIARNEFRLSVIRMLKSALQYYEIQKGGAGYEAGDEDVLEVVGKEVKKRRESIEMFKQGGRPELAEKEEKELEILQSYLPNQMSEVQIRKFVDEAVLETGAAQLTDMGKIMAVLMPKVKGRADGNLVSRLVKERLAQ